MICNGCGLENGEGANYCRKCGTKLTPAASPAPGTGGRKDTRGRMELPRLVWIILALLLLLCLDIILFYFIKPIVEGADTLEYDLEDFSIQMSPNFTDGTTGEVEFEISTDEGVFTVPFTYVDYPYDDGYDMTYFVAVVAKECSPELIDYAARHPGSVTVDVLFNVESRSDSLSLDDDLYEQLEFDRGIFTFQGTRAGKEWYYTAREIVTDDRIYCFYFESYRWDTDVFSKWLRSADPKQDP